ncbi:kinetochore protein NDC80 homolog [Clavelina lepadiformis]|uniref:kinetochore protein NDC80 homolog n=1 Tax=Clavelina lepadiformis TaxID=159417 RepID=UPI0040422032
MHKPQRKPSVGPRESLLSLPSSGLKGPRTTPLIRSTKRPPSSSSKTNQRESFVGAMTVHTVKDTRPLSDKSFIRKSVSELINLLTSLNYQSVINAKIFNPPSNKEYQKVFEFLAMKILGTYRILGKPEEEMLRILKDLGYPYNISKSTLNNVGAMSAWPHALGALIWLEDLVKYTLDVDEPMLDTFELVPIKQLKHTFLSQAYVEFMKGIDGPYDELVENLKQNLEELNKDANEEFGNAQAFNKRLLEDYKTKVNEKEENSHVADGIATTQNNTKKIKQYLLECDNYAQALKAKDGEVKNSIHEEEKEIAAAREALTQLKTAIAQQELGPADLRNLLIEKKQLKEAFNAANERVEQSRKEKWNIEIKFSNLISQLDEQVNDFNGKFMKLVDSLPHIQKSIPEQTLPEHRYLAMGHTGLEENKTALITKIQPFLKNLNSDLLASVGTLDNAKNNLSKRSAQDEEISTDLKSKKGTLQKQFDKLLHDVQTEMLDFNRQQQEIKDKTEECATTVEQLKAAETESVEDLEEQFKQSETKVQKFKDFCQKQKIEAEDYLAKLAAKAKQFQDHHAQLLSRLNTKTKEVEKDFLDRIKDIENRAKQIEDGVKIDLKQ